MLLHDRGDPHLLDLRVALGLAEPMNPTLVTHASHIDLNSIFNGLVATSARTIIALPRACYAMGRRTVELDEWANDKVVDILCAATAGLSAGLLRVAS
eukprot:3342296-Pleurochrysis_carterae.AAC.2